MTPPLTRVGVLTGGGDAPGLNAVIRAVVLAAATAGIECIGIEDGFDGLLDPFRARGLAPADVRDILRRGGTILGTTNQGTPFTDAGATDHDRDRYAARCFDSVRALGLGALVAIGGDGTLRIAHEFHRRGLPVVVVPKTIDNDLPETAATFGFDTAVSVAAEAIDRLRGSAESHHRIMVVEVMGHEGGWLALSAALAAGADVALIPEIRFDLARVADHLRARERQGLRHSVVVVADEARGLARPAGSPGAGMDEPPTGLARLRNIGERVAAALESLTGRDARHAVLGHVQRGGEPTAADRVLATRFGAAAVDFIRASQFGVMASLRDGGIVPVPLERVAGRTRALAQDDDLLRTARRVGMCLG